MKTTSPHPPATFYFKMKIHASKCLCNNSRWLISKFAESGTKRTVTQFFSCFPKLKILFSKLSWSLKKLLRGKDFVRELKQIFGRKEFLGQIAYKKSLLKSPFKVKKNVKNVWIMARIKLVTEAIHSHRTPSISHSYPTFPNLNLVRPILARVHWKKKAFLTPFL